MSRDYKPDYSVRLSEESEHKSLYSWCLREFDKDGKQTGIDQIPWHWGVSFEIDSLSYRLDFEQDSEAEFFEDENAKPPSKKPATKGEALYGRLTPIKSGPSAFGTTQYSFFGTQREIAEFRIRVDEGDEEHISVWGSPTYESEIDFVNETQPDFLEITVVLKPDHFRHIVELVNQKR